MALNYVFAPLVIFYIYYSVELHDVLHVINPPNTDCLGG
jgi:hypothetical protein